MIKKYSFSFLIANCFLILISAYFGSFWLINTQLAFISSFFITLASYFSYKKMINHRIKTNDIPNFDDDFDDINKNHDKSNNLNKKTNILIKKNKKEKIKQTIKSYKGFLAPLRLASYAFLILSFLFLNAKNWLLVFPFLLGLSIIPTISLMSIFINNIYKSNS